MVRGKHTTPHATRHREATHIKRFHLIVNESTVRFTHRLLSVTIIEAIISWYKQRVLSSSYFMLFE